MSGYAIARCALSLHDGGFGRPGWCGVCGFRKQYDPTSVHNHNRYRYTGFRCLEQSVIAHTLRSLQGDVVPSLAEFAHSEVSPCKGDLTENRCTCQLRPTPFVVSLKSPVSVTSA